MDLIKWAEKEIELCQNKDEYFLSCCESALKAYKSLLDDGHSGYSFSVTKSILNYFCDNIPLSPIEDKDFFIENDLVKADESYLIEHGYKSELQCPRRTSLFRTEYIDGTVEYHDVDRVYCYDRGKDNLPYIDGITSSLIDFLYPITMPYSPDINKYHVYIDDKQDGELYVEKIILPSWEIIEMNKTYSVLNDERKYTVDGKEYRINRPIFIEKNIV